MTPPKKQDATLKGSVAWAQKNWKLLAFLGPAVLLFADNMVGKALTGKAATNAIQSAIQPLIDNALMGAKSDMDTLKTEMRRGFKDGDRRMSRVERALLRIPGGKKTLKDLKREEDEESELYGESAGRHYERRDYGSR